MRDRDGSDELGQGRLWQLRWPLCRPPRTYRPRSYACHQVQTQQGNDDSRPSYERASIVCRDARTGIDLGYAHLVVENFRLAALGRFNQVLIKDFQDIFADLGKLGLNLLAVFLDQPNLALITLGLLFLLD